MDGCPHAIDVVLTDKDNRELPQGGHIVGLIHLRLCSEEGGTRMQK